MKLLASQDSNNEILKAIGTTTNNLNNLNKGTTTTPTNSKAGAGTIIDDNNLAVEVLGTTGNHLVLCLVMLVTVFCNYTKI
jgi:hypothetical protein